jgi:hypothetical protein
MLELLHFQSQKTDWLVYEMVEQDLNWVQSTIATRHSLEILFTTLKNLIVNDFFEERTCVSIYKTFLDKRLEGFLQIPLIPTFA